MSRELRPWPQHRASTIFLRVPYGDWSAVKRGIKTEFRAKGREVTQDWNLVTPTPVVAYAMGNGHSYAPRHDSQLMVLEEAHRELLGAITPESLEREGFTDFAHFRRYWMSRTKQRFRPMLEVHVYRVRPFREDDPEVLGAALLRRLYGDHLD